MDRHHHPQRLEIDDEIAVRKVLERMPNQTTCIHRLHELSELPYPDLLATLNRMTHKGLVAKAPEFNLGKDDRTYSLLTDGKLSAEQFVPERLSPLIGLTERTMRDRIIMLKRMKSRLICEWHPVIDVILRDYERDIARVDRSRDPPDPDEPDVLDRDFLQE